MRRRHEIELALTEPAFRLLGNPAQGEEFPHEAERSDREVLERLLAGFRGSGRNKPPAKRCRLARAVGRVVERAFQEGDREALKRVYRLLFEIEIPMSARLARTLRPIDRIESRTAEDYRVKGTPALAVPEWRVLFPPSGEVPREMLTRHTLVLGETGAGKTASCMLPVVAALARTPPDRLGGALIIDPKLELGPVLEELAPERLHHVAADRALVNLMAGPRWVLEADLAAGRWQSAAL